MSVSSRRAGSIAVALAGFMLSCMLTGSLARAQVSATTTLQALEADNTSAASSFQGTPNGNLPAGNVSKVPVSALMYPGATTKYLVAMQGWFGNPKHVSVGYKSPDAAQVQRQLSDMQSRGFQGVTIAWYGSDPDDVSNQTTLQVKAQAEKMPGFVFALRVNDGAVKWHAHGQPPTDALIRQLDYAADHFFSSPAYMRIDGRPVIFEFGLESLKLDWDRIHKEVEGNPIWIFRNASGFTRPYSVGAFAWGPADPFKYLDWFYGKAEQQRGKITVGDVYKGFDDRLASWSKNRVIPQNCGQTWLETFEYIRKYYSAKHQLPMLMVSTWNDYEEGTEIETGIDNCLSINATMQGDALEWAPAGAGRENTVNHYTVFISSDGHNLKPLADLPASAHSLNLAGERLDPGTYTLYVQAVGQPSIRNVVSNPVRYVVQPPPSR